MIKKIDITKFGLFNNYLWDKTIGKEEVFRKLNIFYGRNYSGKTTLSRIFKCIENNQLHPNYADGNFAITMYDGKIITQNNLHEFGAENKIRVYNTDFVKENLSWLHNDDGTIKPFTILGAKNVEIDKQIKVIDEKLGKEDEQKGLLYELAEKIKSYNAKNLEHETKKNELDNKLKTKAQSIKTNSILYNVPTYNITHIKSDLPKATEATILTSEQIDDKKILLKEESKIDIARLPGSKPNFSALSSETDKLITRQIKPSQPITDLVNNSLLQEWVRQGIDKHKDKRETCGFCGSNLPFDLWDKLDAHFSKESEELRNEIIKLIEVLETAKQSLDSFISVNKDDFYANVGVKFEATNKKWSATSKAYSKGIDKLISKLQEREKDIFKEKKLGEVKDESENILELLKEFNALIDEHNLKTSTLSNDQTKARIDLRISEVAQYIKDIDYKKTNDEIAGLLQFVTVLEQEKNKQQKEIDELNEEKRTLEAQAKDESKGAELVNQHLTHFFGHNELRLVAEGVAPNIKFKIVRDKDDAKNLSEGECSLISFCYFIARMEDEMKDNLNNNKLIICIDDPISSLDSNHIFFMFSLIESIITKPKKYGQLFISTHNLDFLKYLKKLTTPDKYQVIANEKKISGLAHFIVERRNKTNSQLNLAPEYLKNYITEFNYLFKQIYKCSTVDEETLIHNYQYSFGNNMRKFLEAYLFYKYPSHSLSLDQRLDKFFENDTVTITLINRVVNEYSHLGEHFDRGIEPIDVEAITKISRAVIGKIESVDPAQYEALLESISEQTV